MKSILFKSTLTLWGALVIASPATAATFDLNSLVESGPGSTQTDTDTDTGTEITVTYEVFTAGTGDYRGSTSFQSNIPLALTNRPTNDGNAFDSQGNPIVNGSFPDQVNIENYTVLTFRWDTTITFVKGEGLENEGFEINDFDYNHDFFPGRGYHDAAAVIAERSNNTFFNVTTSNIGEEMESYNANLIANPSEIVDGSAMELPNFLKDVSSVQGYRNSTHNAPPGPAGIPPTDERFKAIFQDDLERITALHVLYWNETQASDNTFAMGIGFSSAIVVQEDLEPEPPMEIPESPISTTAWVLLGLGGLFFKKKYNY